MGRFVSGYRRMLSRRMWMVSAAAVFLMPFRRWAQETGGAAVREAPSVVDAIKQNHQRNQDVPIDDRRWMGWMIDALLGSTAAFTVYAFLKFQKKPEVVEPEFSEEPASRESHPVYRAGVPPDDSGAEREPCDNGGVLRKRLEAHSREIDRLLKRL